VSLFSNEKAINLEGCPKLIIVVGLVVLLVAYQLVKDPGRVFIYCFIYPVVSLPFYVLFKHEIGLLNILVEVLSMVALVFLFAKARPRIKMDGLVPIFLILLFLVIYGFLLKSASIPMTVALLGMKLLVLPFFLALVSRFESELRARIVSGLFFVQIINALAAAAETILGVDRLQLLGLQYGTNLRNFDSHLRAPGLALTNYNLGAFSAAILFMVYLVLTKQFWLGRKVSYRLCIMSAFASVTCLVLSNFRSGMVFAILAIVMCEVLSRRNFLGSSLVLILGSVALLLAVLFNFFLINSNSSFERQAKWEELLELYDWKIGSGIGFTGAASRSSFSSVSSLIVTDNQFISMLLQFGLFGFVCLVLILLYFFVFGSAVSKSLVMALTAMMLFVEVWDLTSFFTIILFIIFDKISSKKNQFPS
jgi:hypothetical protein